MTTHSSTVARALLGLLLLAPCSVLRASEPATAPQLHDQLVARLRALASVAGAWGPAYQRLYDAALPWYERWGGNPPHVVDDWMVAPEEYATELAEALEHGRNFLAEHPGALVPLVFEKQLPGGATMSANYWLTLPAGFPGEGRTFPLVVGLHGSGWLGHKISFVRAATKEAGAGRTLAVTPINEGGPWSIDFLNAYLDELQRLLPVDDDRVYVEGHSLGAMATWEWALHNPERFAAISPRSGVGEPYRAARLQHVPSWVIHGDNDDVLPAGFSDQMVAALQAVGASTRYSRLAGVGHNMPDDLDQGQVVDWYLRQTRSHEPVPADPRDQLGLDEAGFSHWEIITEGEARFWKSEPLPFSDRGSAVRAVHGLFARANVGGELSDALVRLQLDVKSMAASYWLKTPQTLRLRGRLDAQAVVLPAARYVRCYVRGETGRALAHLAEVRTEFTATGGQLADEVWIIPLSLWPDTPAHIAEYRLAVRPGP